MKKTDRSTRICNIKFKRVVAKAKGKAFDELYEKLDTKEAEKDLYRERQSWQRCATG